jgi:SAM-dependent methyltransferase
MMNRRVGTYHCWTCERETKHTFTLLDPILRLGDSVLDVGCGHGYIPWQLDLRGGFGDLCAVDIVDCRTVPTPHFALYDGLKIPLEDKRFDVVMLNFVLHHVPNDKKPLLLAEVARVCRRDVFILEDTPKNVLDRLMNRRHGEQHRREIGSTADYGFYSREEWHQRFRDLGFFVRRSQPLGRFARWWRQPHARTAFVLGV